MFAFCGASSIHSEYFLYAIDPSIAEHSKRFVFEDNLAGGERTSYHGFTMTAIFSLPVLAGENDGGRTEHPG